MPVLYDIDLLAAPSILGLKPTGVERLAQSLLDAGLTNYLRVTHPVVHVPTLNEQYSDERDPVTLCLNPVLIREFSLQLEAAVSRSLRLGRFPMVLGGDCSVLVGILPALKQAGNYGLLFVDAHADFYAPENSITGEVADMDLAIVTGRGPDLLTNIHQLRPYVPDEKVVHIGQRDEAEAQRYGSPDIRDTAIRCFSFATIREQGMEAVTNAILQHLPTLPADRFWIHFDTDVLSDDINPAVEYHLPGGLNWKEITFLLHHLLRTGRIAGMTVTIFNPAMDTTGTIAPAIVRSLGKMFDGLSL